MTTVWYSPELYGLDIEGHAGAGSAGSDPVCAAASILMWTMAEAATEEKEFHAELYIGENEPRVELRCMPDREHRTACRQMLDLIMRGFRLLAEQYPAYVRVITEGGD